MEYWLTGRYTGKPTYLLSYSSRDDTDGGYWSAGPAPPAPRAPSPRNCIICVIPKFQTQNYRKTKKFWMRGAKTSSCGESLVEVQLVK